MTTDKRRTIIGRFLLAVYLMILAVGAFHVHEHVEDDFVCQDCINHVDHAGHISVGDVAMDDCLLCSFFSTTYIGVQCVAIVFACIVLVSIFSEQTQKVSCRERCIISLRAPPCLLINNEF